MTYQNLLVATENGVLTVTVNRPDKMNALNRSVLNELRDVFETMPDGPEIMGVIITGAGPKAFVAGADISEFQGLSPLQAKQFAENGQKIFQAIEDCPRPVIAAVNGFALGGGCELAMACHLRVASANARFGQPEVNLGIIPGYGGTQRLTRLTGKTKALELMLTTDMLTAEDALRYGLVNYVVPPEQLLPKCFEIIEKIKTKAPVAISSVIKSVNAYFKKGIDGFQFEAEEFSKCCGTEDFVEGTMTFLEKRKAKFLGK